MKNYKLIICCGINRSGSTWTYQVIKDLFSNIPYRDLSFLKADEANKIEHELANSNVPILVKMHEYPKFLDSLGEEMKNAKLIYSHRDLRDIVLSLSRKNNRPIEEMMDMPFLKKSINSYKEWMKYDGFLSVDYKDIINSPTSTILTMANHLNISITEEEAKVLAKKLSIENQQKRINKSKYSLQGLIKFLLYKMHLIGNVKDVKTLLHYDHIKSGKVDEWRDILSYNQSQKIIEKYFEWMKSFNYIQ